MSNQELLNYAIVQRRKLNTQPDGTIANGPTSANLAYATIKANIFSGTITTQAQVDAAYGLMEKVE